MTEGFDLTSLTLATRLVGRRRLMKAFLIAAAAVAADPLLSACSSASSGGATGTTVTQAALAEVLRGSWAVYAWNTPTNGAGSLPTEAAKYGITDPLEMDKVFEALKVPPATLAVSDKTFSLTLDGSQEGQGVDWWATDYGNGLKLDGTWDLVARRVSVNIPVVQGTKYRTAESFATGVPLELKTDDTGSFTWSYANEGPDMSITYAVGRDRLYVNNSHSGSEALVVRST